MAPTSFQKSSCPHCGNHIEYPSDAAGVSVTCPHCQQWVQLPAAPPDRIVKKSSPGASGTAPRSGPSLRLTKAGWVGMIAYLAYMLVVVLRTDAAGAGKALFGVTVLAGGAALSGWVAYRLTRRSARVGNMVFTVILVVPLLFAVVMGLRDNRQRRNAWEQVKPEFARVENFSEYMRALEQFRARLPRRDAQAVSAFEDSLRGLADKAMARLGAIQAFTNAGAVDPVTLRTKSDIEHRSELLMRVLRSNDEMAQAVTEFPGAFHARLDPLRETRAGRQILEGFERSSFVAELSRLCEVDRQLCQSFQAQLALLERSWGKWGWRMDDHQVLFKDATTLEAYNRNQERISELSEEESSIFERLRARRGK